MDIYEHGYTIELTKDELLDLKQMASDAACYQYREAENLKQFTSDMWQNEINEHEATAERYQNISDMIDRLI